jgi:hypothetical protein
LSREATAAHSCGRQPADPGRKYDIKPRSGDSKITLPGAAAASRLTCLFQSISVGFYTHGYVLSPLRG